MDIINEAIINATEILKSDIPDSKADDLNKIAATIQDDQDVTVETPEEDVTDKPKRGRKRGSIASSTGKKSISIALEPNDLKKLRFLALANERTVRDEIVALVNESYKIVAKKFIEE